MKEFFVDVSGIKKKVREKFCFKEFVSVFIDWWNKTMKSIFETTREIPHCTSSY
jgi:hypothetical protein